MVKKFLNSALSEYMGWFVKQISGLLTDPSNQKSVIYRIADWEKSKEANKEDRLIVQMIGRASIPLKFTPTEIFNDETLLSCFSSSDVKVISVLAMAYKNKPKYKIAVDEFRDELGKKIIAIQSNDKATLIRKSVDELAKNLDIVKEFSAEDAFRLGIAFGEHDAARTQEEINQLKKDSKK